MLSASQTPILPYRKATHFGAKENELLNKGPEPVACALWMSMLIPLHLLPHRD